MLLRLYRSLMPRNPCFIERFRELYANAACLAEGDSVCVGLALSE